jgi:hypothetical protein
LAFNTEFTKEPICTASKKYQKLKLEQLQSLQLPQQEYEKQVQKVLDKECLCVGLSNSAAINYQQTFVKKLEAVTICPGPNIANFSKVVSLQTMTDHIYGRENIMENKSRPHMFIAELNLYMNYLHEQLAESPSPEQDVKKKKYITSFCNNLREGINYYRNLSGVAVTERAAFDNALNCTEEELNILMTAHL